MEGGAEVPLRYIRLKWKANFSFWRKGPIMTEPRPAPGLSHRFKWLKAVWAGFLSCSSKRTLLQAMTACMNSFIWLPQKVKTHLSSLTVQTSPKTVAEIWGREKAVLIQSPYFHFFMSILILYGFLKWKQFFQKHPVLISRARATEPIPCVQQCLKQAKLHTPGKLTSWVGLLDSRHCRIIHSWKLEFSRNII